MSSSVLCMLLTDICHQVLDLYSATAPKKAEVSPPLTMPTSQPAQGQLSNVSNITTIGHQQTRQQPVQVKLLYKFILIFTFFKFYNSNS